MIELDSLRDTSLQLVGKNQRSSTIAMASSKFKAPWDEMSMEKLDDHNSANRNNSIMATRHLESADTVVPEMSPIAKLTGPDESRWRSHGLARRKQLLEEDERKGGRTFDLKFDSISVHRYFSVAHWALEQFHALYQAGSDLEECYVMGYRIIAFLTQCLPQHPGLRSAPMIRQRARDELDLLKECLEDVALQIDEETCNRFVDEFDPLFAVGDEEDEDDSVNEDSTLAEELDQTMPLQNPSSQPMPATCEKTPDKPAKRSQMVRFEHWQSSAEETDADACAQHERKSVESPTADTVETTGTGSMELLDTSHASALSDHSYDFPHTTRLTQEALENVVDVDLDTSGHLFGLDGIDQSIEEYDAAFPSMDNHYFHRHVRLDFLDRIADEPVLFETDSEAADSWAQTPQEILSIQDNIAPSSSGISPTCDPARIAFRDLMNRIPRQSLLQDMKRDHGIQSSEKGHHGMGKSQQYLDSEEDGDATRVESNQQKLNQISGPKAPTQWNIPSKATAKAAIPSSPLSYFSSSSDSSQSSGSSHSSLQQHEEASAFRPYSRDSQERTKAPSKVSREMLTDKNFLVDDDWISFGDSNNQEINFFAS